MSYDNLSSFLRMFWNFISSLPVKRGGSLSFLVGTISNVLVMKIGWTDVGSGGYILVSCAHSNTSYIHFEFFRRKLSLLASISWKIYEYDMNNTATDWFRKIDFRDHLQIISYKTRNNINKWFFTSPCQRQSELLPSLQVT